MARCSAAVIVLALVVAVTTVARPVWGLDSDLDPSFGVNGIVATPTTAVSSEMHALLLQDDGRLVVAGGMPNGPKLDMALVRYNSDGSLDTTFGVGGVVLTPIGTGRDVAYAAVQQIDGKLVVAGSSRSGLVTSFALARFLEDGSLDPGFGTGGIVTTTIGNGWAEAYSLLQQADGKLVAAGAATTGGGPLPIVAHVALARYDLNGSLDQLNFGSNGVVLTNVGVDAAIRSIAQQPDGKLVGAGGASGGFLAIRYDGAGLPDPSFGLSGWSTASLGSGVDVAEALALQPDGRIVLGGYSLSTRNSFALARFTAAGALDSSFGSGGWVETPVGTDSRARGLILQPDAKLVVAGYARVDFFNVDFALARYHPDGSLDDSFGTGGIVTTELAEDDRIRALVRQPDGRLVAAGLVGNSQFALARYGSPCGNGLLETGEQCDDGNTVGGDCCSSECEFEPTGSACDDHEPCTSDLCDGAGRCESTAVADGTDCSDGSFCSGAEICTGGVCEPGNAPCSGGCDEVNDRCVLGCPALPQTCRTARKALLAIADPSNDARDNLMWNWVQGAATTPLEFGDPRTTANYALCLYDASGQLLPGGVVRVQAHAAKWSVIKNRGFKYIDRSAASDGVRSLVLKGGPQAKSKIVFRAGGSSLPDPSLPFAMPLTVQLVNDQTTACWGTTFNGADVLRNVNTQFTARAR